METKININDIWKSVWHIRSSHNNPVTYAQWLSHQKKVRRVQIAFERYRWTQEQLLIRARKVRGAFAPSGIVSRDGIHANLCEMVLTKEEAARFMQVPQNLLQTE